MENYGIITFNSASVAMRAENYFKQITTLVRIIPTPQKLAAKCGFSLKYDLSYEKELLNLLKSNNFDYDKNYHVSKENFTFDYEEVK